MSYIPSEVGIAVAQPPDVPELWLDTSAPGGATVEYVLKSGDTMTGNLTLPGNPSSVLDAVPKQYVDTYRGTGLVVPNTGWAEFSGTSAGLFVTKYAGMVTLECGFKRTGTGQANTAGTGITIGTIPVGYRPSHDVVGVQDNSSLVAGFSSATPSGSLYYTLYQATTIATNGYVFIAMTYRQGN